MSLWGGRFESGPGEILWAYTTDASDRRLLADDVAGSMAHVRMLGETGILAVVDVKALLGGLETIQSDAASGAFEFSDVGRGRSLGCGTQVVRIGGGCRGQAAHRAVPVTTRSPSTCVSTHDGPPASESTSSTNSR